jgi:hypothetical protein
MVRMPETSEPNSHVILSALRPSLVPPRERLVGAAREKAFRWDVRLPADGRGCDAGPSGGRDAGGRDAGGRCRAAGPGAVVVAALHFFQKIDETAARVWMAVLRAQPRAVLWLYGGQAVAPSAEPEAPARPAGRSTGGATRVERERRAAGDDGWMGRSMRQARARLEAFARAHGVRPSRLRFLPHVESRADFFRRLSAADLVVDTLGWTAHSTCADALWAGVPVLTRVGASASARKGAAFLRAALGPDTELLTRSARALEETAVRLVRAPERLQRIRERVAALPACLSRAARPAARAGAGDGQPYPRDGPAEGEDCSPLWDSTRWTRAFEAALEQVWSNHVEGAHGHIEVRAE